MIVERGYQENSGMGRPVVTDIESPDKNQPFYLTCFPAPRNSAGDAKRSNFFIKCIEGEGMDKLNEAEEFRAKAINACAEWAFLADVNGNKAGYDAYKRVQSYLESMRVRKD